MAAPKKPSPANTPAAEATPAAQEVSPDVADAIIAAGTGKMHKVLFFDEKGEALGEYASAQLPDNPFQNRMDRLGLQYPPFPLEQLVLLAEQHPIHGSCIEQKVVDTVGQGWLWEPDQDVARPADAAAPDPADREKIDAWLNGLAQGEETFHEVLMRAWDDKVVTGQGYLELIRDATGKLVQVLAIPAQTCRIHHDGIRIAQIRGSKMVWFKRWGSPPDIQGREQQVDRQYGSIKSVGSGDEVPAGRLANEILVLQKPSRRSSWYGIPDYVSAIGWLSLALSVRDDNLLFFSNRREPRWAILLTNMEDDPNLEDDLRTALAVDLKQPHRNLIIPISGNGKIDFKQLTSDTRDGSYMQLDDRADAKVLVAHRMPPERLGMTKVGTLGGDVSVDSSRVYKEATIEPEQAMLKGRMNRFIAREYPGNASAAKAAGVGTALQNTMGWKWTPVALDLAEESEDLDKGVTTFKNGMCPLDEARRLARMAPLDPTVYGDPAGEGEERGMGGKFYFELFKQGSPTPQPGDDSGFGGAGEQAIQAAVQKTLGATAVSVARVDAAIEELFATGAGNPAA